MFLFMRLGRKLKFPNKFRTLQRKVVCHRVVMDNRILISFRLLILCKLIIMLNRTRQRLHSKNQKIKFS